MRAGRLHPAQTVRITAHRPLRLLFHLQPFYPAGNFLFGLWIKEMADEFRTVSGRTINAMQRSDTRYNSINSYAMLHVVYRLNMFGGKNANSRRRQDRPDYDRPSMPPQGTPGMAPGMPYRGNGGFGRLR